MKELERMAVNLKQDFAKKEKEILSQTETSAHTRGLIENGRNEVESFSESIKKISKDPLLRNEIIKNFSKDFKRIQRKIEKIK